MHIIPHFFGFFLPSLLLEGAQKCLKNARRQPFGGLKHTTAQVLFTLRVSPAWRRERKKTNSTEDRSCSRASGGVGKSVSATQTVRLTAAWCGQLISSCNCECTTSMSWWINAVTGKGSVDQNLHFQGSFSIVTAQLQKEMYRPVEFDLKPKVNVISRHKIYTFLPQTECSALAL